MPRKGWLKPDRKNRHIRVRVSPDELVAIREKAENADMSVSAFVRDQALYGKIIVQKPPYPPSPIDFDELLDVGELVNNLAKSSNSGQGVDRDALKDAKNRLHTLLADISAE